MEQEEAKELRERLRDPDVEKRVEAVRELGENGDDSAIPFVYGALEDRVLEVRCAALETLMTLRPGVAVLTAIDKAASFDAGERRAAVRLLRDHPDERSLVRLHSVASNAQENDDVRAMALEALGRLGDERSLPIVMELLEDEATMVRVAALRLLRELPFDATDATNGHMDIARQLGAALTDTRDLPEVHAEIARTLGSVAGWFALPRLVDLLDDERENVRAAAVDGVSVVESATTHEELPNALLRLLNHETSSVVRASLARAAARLGLKDGIDRIVEYLGDDSADVRLAAVDGLVELGAEDFIDDIRELEDDESEEVRVAVEAVLKKFAPEDEPEEGEEDD